jgi:hypothetical protein
MTGEGEKRWKQTEEYGRKEQRAKHKEEIEIIGEKESKKTKQKKRQQSEIENKKNERKKF